jgi:predicted translation initiation factor SUI1
MECLNLFHRFEFRRPFRLVPSMDEKKPLSREELERGVAGLLAGLSVPKPAPVAVPVSATKPPKGITLKVGRETAGRRGKGVTTVFDTPFDEAQLAELAGLLKQKCGTGGTAKDGRIEIQGDQRERIVAELEKLGYKVKRAGG